MYPTKRRLLICIALGTVMLPMTSHAQEPSVPVADSLQRLSPAERGRYDGMLAARGVATAGWMATGLIGGVVAGPIGAGVNFAIASAREAPDPPESLLTGAQASASGAYREAFTEAYRARIRSNRRSASIMGGLTGSVVFAFVLLQIANWDGGSGSAGGGGGGELP